MGDNKIRVLIVGEAAGAEKFLGEFKDCPFTKVIGVITKGPEDGSAKRLRGSGVSLFSKLESVPETARTDSVLVLDDEDIDLKRLSQIPKPAIIGKTGAGLLLQMKRECNKAQERLKEAKDELEIQAWGLKKTNEGVKLLYKELEEKNRRLKELDRLKSDFLSAVSHELRTPLSVTKEGISLILDEIPGKINDKQKSILLTAKNNIDRLARMINNLLDISKIESGKTQLKKEVVDIVGIARQVVSFFEPKASKKGVEINAFFDKKRIELYIDADKITQVFTNLMGNALKFTEKGKIDLIVSEGLKEVECVVSDTGIGISEEDIAKIFDKFQQVGKNYSPGEKGTGLGLSIAKEIVEMHKGSIEAESRQNNGTRFRFVLPKFSWNDVIKDYINLGIMNSSHNDKAFSVIKVSAQRSGDAGKRGIDKKEDAACAAEMLKALSAKLRSSKDKAVRDGNEFFVILNDCARQDALKVIDRIKQGLEAGDCGVYCPKGIEYRTELATYPHDAKTSGELMKILTGGKEQ